MEPDAAIAPNKPSQLGTQAFIQAPDTGQGRIQKARHPRAAFVQIPKKKMGSVPIYSQAGEFRRKA